MTGKANVELRLYAMGKGVRMWQVAEKFGISEAYFCKKMRNELSDEEAEKFKKFVDEIAEEQRLS
jgi:hypothetical protein